MSKQNNKQLSFFSGISFEKLYEQFYDVELFTFRNNQGDSENLTGKILQQQVEVLGEKLETLDPQEKAIILLPQGLEYICSILACFYANVTAIPTSVVRILSGTELTDKIMPIVLDSGANHIITDTDFKALLDKNTDFSKLDRKSVV